MTEMEVDTENWASLKGPIPIGKAIKGKAVAMGGCVTSPKLKNRKQGKRQRDCEAEQADLQTRDGKRVKVNENSKAISVGLEKDGLEAKLFTASVVTDFEDSCSYEEGNNFKEVDVSGYVEWAKVGSRPRLQQ